MSQHDIASTTDTTNQNTDLTAKLNKLSSAQLFTVWHRLTEGGAIAKSTAATAAGIVAALSREQIQGVLMHLSQWY